ncbi:MAG: minichromosome maintenance protein MCM [Nanoarchaeota archaeon]
MENKERRYEELIQEAKNFLKSNRKHIGESIRTGERVVVIKFTTISEYSPDLAEAILETPEPVIILLEQAMDELGFIKDLRVRFSELPKTAKTKVREIRAKHLDQLIEVEGIVRQISEVRPQVINARFECPTCGAILSVRQRDRKFVKPSKCSCGCKYDFKLLSKEMVDTQYIVVEESPDLLESEKQSTEINVLLKEDLVDPKMQKYIIPGNKIKIIGIIKDIQTPLKVGSKTISKKKFMIEANNIFSLEETFECLPLSEEDTKEIKELSTDPNLFKKLVESISPSVYGKEEIKETILLQLFGGVENKKSGLELVRGEINVLLAGASGVAKTTILKFASSIAPKGKYFQCRRSNGNISAKTIKYFGESSLEPGIIVLSNNGILCLDEIEDISKKDQESIYNILKDQSVEIPKVGTKIDLKINIGLLVAISPKKRFYNCVPFTDQINISKDLLNMFDIVFIIHDEPNEHNDGEIASRVLQEHKQEVNAESIPQKLLRKYIFYARQKIKPVRTDIAIKEITKFYSELRQSNSKFSDVYINVRNPESIMRLAEAHARMRLSNQVDLVDARKAIELFTASLKSQGGLDPDSALEKYPEN